ncbi:MAG TPA: hypothetical protein VKD90_18925, partial [Gemmataceae bacterium]|nr:hypothetical protein [Gemmataceae bacterium]
RPCREYEHACPPVRLGTARSIGHNPVVGQRDDYIELDHTPGWPPPLWALALMVPAILTAVIATIQVLRILVAKFGRDF